MSNRTLGDTFFAKPLRVTIFISSTIRIISKTCWLFMMLKTRYLPPRLWKSCLISLFHPGWLFHPGSSSCVSLNRLKIKDIMHWLYELLGHFLMTIFYSGDDVIYHRLLAVTFSIHNKDSEIRFCKIKNMIHFFQFSKGITIILFPFSKLFSD